MTIMRKPTMSHEQYLLGKFAEELVELAQIALKAQQFGLSEVYTADGNTLTNAERMHLETTDVQAVLEMLNEECALGYTPSRKQLEAKKVKVRKWEAYAASLGQVAPKIH